MLYSRVTKIYSNGRGHGVKDGFFFTKGQTNIINEDLFTTRQIGPESIDLIITSPPYNVDIQYNNHDDQITYDEYLAFSKRWMKRCYGWLKDDGR
ncbi:MAG: DNA methyltransferase, partial [Methanoregula sp.]|nr:DNA methyltransferase [Methanoregula sp.]